ncbi:MAG: translation elongation factor-like protein [Deltaproteobacteria bacterium]|nr:translation elongation factor-like protein [Deltaproteobacteria bacterium]
MSESKVGEVIKFFAKPMVAAIRITSGTLAVGDRLHFAGFTTDFEAAVESMQEEHAVIETAGLGQTVGIKVPERCRPGDEVFKID